MGEAFASDSQDEPSSRDAVASSHGLINPLAQESQSPVNQPSSLAPFKRTPDDLGPLETENSPGGFGKLVDPLAQSEDTGSRPLPDAQTAVAGEWSTAAHQRVLRGWDRRVARTSAEVDSELAQATSENIATSGPETPQPSSPTPARLAQKQPNPYLDAVAPVVPPTPSAMPPSPGSASNKPYGPTTTYIDPSYAETRPVFDFTAEALVWRLEHANSSQPMIQNPILGQTVLTNALDLGYQAGPRISMEFLSDEEETIHSFEIGYFGIYNWFDRVTVIAPAGTFLRLPDVLGDPGVTTDFAAANSMVARYQARVNSVELNVFFGDRDARFHWAIGPRFIRWEENFLLNSFTAPRWSYYQVDTLNDLWGVQWVGRWRGFRGRWEFTGICKVGIYDNQARQSTLLTDNDRTVELRNFGPTDTVASLLVEGGLSAAYQFNGTWLARFGYNVLYLDNVARATDQLDFSNNANSGNRVFFRQDALAHGFNCGLEARW